MEAEPVEDPLEVVPDGVCAQSQPIGDGRVGESFCREQRDLRLAPAEPKRDPQLLSGRKQASVAHGLMESGETGKKGTPQEHDGDERLRYVRDR